MLDLMLDFFDDGSKWSRGWGDYLTGTRCLVGAMSDIRARYKISGDHAREYIIRAIPRDQQWSRFRGLMDYNDRHEGGWPELSMVLNKARHLALCDANGWPRPEIRKPTMARENYRLNAQRRLQALHARIDLLEQLYADRRSERVRWITEETYVLCPTAEPSGEPQRLAA
jgi:hypothetical protein